jgi:hypothetical protein
LSPAGLRGRSVRSSRFASKGFSARGGRLLAVGFLPAAGVLLDCGFFGLPGLPSDLRPLLVLMAKGTKNAGKCRQRQGAKCAHPNCWPMHLSRRLNNSRSHMLIWAWVRLFVPNR